MFRVLLLTVRFHDGRYHGVPDWPCSPARLFQALVAGAARGAELPSEARQALAWLERLEPPVIAVPPARAGAGYVNFVPNNDLDARGGDPARVADIRIAKTIRPRLFDAALPLLYGWRFEDEAEARLQAEAVCGLAERLYQLGRGVDTAWARGEFLSPEAFEARLAAHPGPIHRPSETGGGDRLDCPRAGTLSSLRHRYQAHGQRFSAQGKRLVFTQPPKGRFVKVAYDSPPVRRVFHIRHGSSGGFAPQALTLAAEPREYEPKGVVALTEHVRDLAVARLEASDWRRGDPKRQARIERVFIGRGAQEADKALRLRITPLPSIGHSHAEQSIRRVLLEIPPNCPIPAEDVAWAFSGLVLEHHKKTGEVLAELVAEPGDTMLRHYGVDEEEAPPRRRWRTVTPAALPERAARRRLEPACRGDRDAEKPGSERAGEEARAASAVARALRHAGIAVRPLEIRVQREPFSRRGARAEAFAPGTRFAKTRLWHVEITFQGPVTGPLLIGDGRYLGLGLMAPVADDAPPDLFLYRLAQTARPPLGQLRALMTAVRRALMARAREPDGTVPRLFSGHEPEGGPARSGAHEHVFLWAEDTDGDGRLDLIGLAAPWRVDRARRAKTDEAERFAAAVGGLETLRAGRLGVLALSPASDLAARRAIASAKVWVSATPYRPTRYPKRGDPATALAADVARECQRRGLPRPVAEALEVSEGPRGGLAGWLRLTFAHAVAGPLLLGRDSHAGGGLFVPGA